MSDEADRVVEAVGAAIGAAVGTDLVLKWVALVEVIDGDTNERGLWCLAPKEMTAWDTLGMLEYAKQLELAQTVREQ